MGRIRTAAIIVGHNGPRTGAWWVDEHGELDEWALAQETAIAAAFNVQARGWRTRIVTGNHKNPHHLYSKGGMVERIAPDVAVSIHYGMNVKEKARGNGWPGVEASAFADGHVPDESSFAAGVNVCFFQPTPAYMGGPQPGQARYPSGRFLGQRLVRETMARTALTMANDDGLDPRAEVTLPGYSTLYLLRRLDKTCPVVVYEAATLSSPADREVLRTDSHVFDKLGDAVGAALDDWYLEFRHQPEDD
jgi:hypothetical protein